MQLAIRRSWSNTELVIICQIRLTEEERDLVEAYNLYDTSIWSSSPPFKLYKLADFLRGVTISNSVVSGEGRSMDNMRQFFLLEDQLMDSIDHFYESLNRCRSFRQESIIEFPRKDDAVDVRVKNVVRTSS
jgi:hypothetical protein